MAMPVGTCADNAAIKSFLSLLCKRSQPHTLSTRQDLRPASECRAFRWRRPRARSDPYAAIAPLSVLLQTCTSTGTPLLSRRQL